MNYSDFINSKNMDSIHLDDFFNSIDPSNFRKTYDHVESGFSGINIENPKEHWDEKLNGVLSSVTGVNLTSFRDAKGFIELDDFKYLGVQLLDHFADKIVRGSFSALSNYAEAKTKDGALGLVIAGVIDYAYIKVAKKLNTFDEKMLDKCETTDDITYVGTFLRYANAGGELYQIGTKLFKDAEANTDGDVNKKRT